MRKEKKPDGFAILEDISDAIRSFEVRSKMAEEKRKWLPAGHGDIAMHSGIKYAYDKVVKVLEDIRDRHEDEWGRSIDGEEGSREEQP